MTSSHLSGRNEMCFIRAPLISLIRDILDLRYSKEKALELGEAFVLLKSDKKSEKETKREKDEREIEERRGRKRRSERGERVAERRRGGDRRGVAASPTSDDRAPVEKRAATRTAGAELTSVRRAAR
ncbi:hypothetical protein Scep_029044 [Stephania cephalantha]|uniref:Uncharacterized protein n=1 Tax=Stephania cephalantha TaxID=152367 RepID=A0AAP0HBW5_9MAGN